MAGMGIGMVLIAAAIVASIMAGMAAVVLGAATWFATKGIQGRLKVVLTASVFPFVCLGWAGLVFFFQAFVNQELLHRDPGAGDAWQCPLPNGYGILMIDVTDHGWVYNPKTQIR
jgi:hypothetical protein